MKRLSGRSLGIGLAVLLVGALALYAAGAGRNPAASAGSIPGATGATGASGTQTVQVLSTGTMAGLALKVGIVAALLGGSLWLLRRYAGTQSRSGGRTGAISIADTIPLAQGRVLYVLDVGDRALVIGATPQQLSLVGEITDAGALTKLRAPVPSPVSPLSDISHRFEAAVQGISRLQAAAATRRGRHTDDEADADASPLPSFARTLAAYDRPPTPLRVVEQDAGAPQHEWATEHILRISDTHAAADGSEGAQPASSERLRALAERLRAARESA